MMGLATDSDGQVGRRYRIERVIGRGGFGTVYKAELLAEGDFRKPVALKVLNANLDEQGDLAGRLRDEARILGKLSHRALVYVHGLARLDDRWTVVMEYVDGVDLNAALGSGPLPPRAALEVIVELASALHMAWHVEVDGRQLCLLHRDIKPANVLLTADGDVKLLDFGIARANFDDREALTQGKAMGTPGPVAVVNLAQATAGPMVWLDGGRRLLVGTDEGQLLAWSPETGLAPWGLVASGPILDLSVSPDGQRVAIGDQAGTVRIATDTGTELAAIAGLPRLPVHLDLRGGWLTARLLDGAVARWPLDALDLPAQQLYDEASARWGLALEGGEVVNRVVPSLSP